MGLMSMHPRATLPDELAVATTNLVRFSNDLEQLGLLCIILDNVQVRPLLPGFLLDVLDEIRLNYFREKPRTNRTTLPDGCEQVLFLIGGLFRSAQTDKRKQIGNIEIREDPDNRLIAEIPDSDPQVEERSSAAQDEVPALRIGNRQGTRSIHVHGHFRSRYPE